MVPFDVVETEAVAGNDAHVYQITTQAGATKYVAWGSGVWTVPANAREYTTVVPDDLGNFSWQEIEEGESLALSDTPVLLK